MAFALRSPSKHFGIGLAFGLSVAGSIATAAPADAIGALPLLYGTGVSATGQTITKPTGGTVGTDANWNIFQLPNNTNSGSLPSPANIPTDTTRVWIGSGPTNTVDDNNGATIDGTTYRWISPSTSIQALTADVPGNNQSLGVADFNYILKQEFTVNDAGYYFVSIYLTGDNQTDFYVNGSVSGGATLTPTITGGTLVGSSDTTPGNLGRISNILNYVYLNAGTNNAYLVVNDKGSFTGVLASNANFDRDVPAPLPLLGAGAAFGWSRRLRRRINSRTTLG